MQGYDGHKGANNM